MNKKVKEVIEQYLETNNKPYEYILKCSKYGGYNWLKNRLEKLEKWALNTGAEINIIEEPKRPRGEFYVIILNISDPAAHEIDKIKKYF